MSYVRIVLTLVLEILFPRSPSVAQFDHIDASLLEECVRDTIFIHDLEVIAPLSYRTPLIRDAIHAAKFYGHKRASALLGEALAGFVAEEIAERRMFGTCTAPLVVPIPLHAERLRERTFNQSERIARSLAQHVSGVPLRYIPEALVRTRHTHSQTRLSRAKRLSNIRGAFAVPNPKVIRGKNILLIDDVVTTGATLREARRTLLAAGATDVLCVAVAH